MSQRAPLSGLVCVVVACALVGFAWVTTAQAKPYSLSGNARFQIGNGLPLPFGFTPAAPVGKILAIPGATAQQTNGADPKKLTIAPSQLTRAQAPGVGPVFLANPKVFQVGTSIGFKVPRVSATFAKSGRTGPSTVTWCPGRPLPTGGPTTGFNPGCPNPVATTLPSTGRMKYTKTLNQFGGTASAKLAGPVNLAFAGPVPAPCNIATNAGCVAAFALVTPASNAVIGGPFGTVVSTPGGAPNPGLFGVNVAANGLILSATPTGLGPGVANTATSWGGPWTTGKITVEARSTAGAGTELMVLSGSDGRVNGFGTISLVSSGVSMRAGSGPNANRSWLNLTLGLPATFVPTLSRGAILLLVALVTGATLVMVRRATATAS